MQFMSKLWAWWHQRKPLINEFVAVREPIAEAKAVNVNLTEQLMLLRSILDVSIKTHEAINAAIAHTDMHPLVELLRNFNESSHVIANALTMAGICSSQTLKTLDGLVAQTNAQLQQYLSGEMAPMPRGVHVHYKG